MQDNHKNDSLLLTLESNALDSLKKSCLFLREIPQDRFYIKWFVIAFHHTLHCFIILALSKVNSDQVFYPSKEEIKLEERYILKFMDAYRKLKRKKCMDLNPYKPSKNQNLCMNELNSNLRNIMVHFSPNLMWSTGEWYPARVCEPLLEILTFCSNVYGTSWFQNKANKEIEDIRSILITYKG